MEYRVGCLGCVPGTQCGLLRSRVRRNVGWCPGPPNRHTHVAARLFRLFSMHICCQSTTRLGVEQAIMLRHIVEDIALALRYDSSNSSSRTMFSLCDSYHVGADICTRRNSFLPSRMAFSTFVWMIKNELDREMKNK